MFNKKNKRNHSITIKSQNGNTIGHINLSAQYIKAMTGKQQEYATVEDINAINNGNLMEVLSKATLVIADPNNIVKLSDPGEY